MTHRGVKPARPKTRKHRESKRAGRAGRGGGFSLFGGSDAQVWGVLGLTTVKAMRYIYRHSVESVCVARHSPSCPGIKGLMRRSF